MQGCRTRAGRGHVCHPPGATHSRSTLPARTFAALNSSASTAPHAIHPIAFMSPMIPRTCGKSTCWEAPRADDNAAARKPIDPVRRGARGPNRIETPPRAGSRTPPFAAIAMKILSFPTDFADNRARCCARAQTHAHMYDPGPQVPAPKRRETYGTAYESIVDSPHVPGGKRSGCGDGRPRAQRLRQQRHELQLRLHRLGHGGFGRRLDGRQHEHDRHVHAVQLLEGIGARRELACHGGPIRARHGHLQALRRPGRRRPGGGVRDRVRGGAARRRRILRRHARHRRGCGEVL